MTIKRTENISCDGDKCDKTRDQDSNHWLVGYMDGGLILIAQNRNKLPEGMWGDDEEVELDERKLKDFCGEECAIKWVSKMLTEIKK